MDIFSAFGIDIFSSSGMDTFSAFGIDIFTTLYAPEGLSALASVDAGFSALGAGSLNTAEDTRL